MIDLVSRSESRTASSASTRTASRPPWQSNHTRIWIWRSHLQLITRPKRRPMPTWLRVRKTSSLRTWWRNQRNYCHKEVRVALRALMVRISSPKLSQKNSKKRWRERRLRIEVATKTSCLIRTRKGWVECIRRVISIILRTNSKSKWGKHREIWANQRIWNPSSTSPSIKGKTLETQSCSHKLRRPPRSRI